MRALCGAIITAAALIGMGLTAMGIGQRYSMAPAYHSDRASQYQSKAEKAEKQGLSPRVVERVKFGDVDRPLIFTLTFLTCVALVGLGIAFVGLAYHHARREREYQLEKERLAAHHRTTV